MHIKPVKGLNNTSFSQVYINLRTILISFPYEIKLLRYVFTSTAVSIVLGPTLPTTIDIQALKGLKNNKRSKSFLIFQHSKKIQII